MTAISGVQAKGETMIPKAIREVLELQPGDAVAWQQDGKRAIVTKLVSDSPMELAADDVADNGILPKGWRMDAQDILAAIHEERGEQ